LRENQFCSGTYTRDGIYVYNGAQHGFGRDERASYSKPDYELAQQQRTLDLFAKHLAESQRLEGRSPPAVPIAAA